MAYQPKPVGEVVANDRGGLDFRFFEQREIVPGMRFLLVPTTPQYRNIPLAEEVRPGQN